jgi:dTDP-4-amino-4,6-dideoxygalactose transaminase
MKVPFYDLNYQNQIIFDQVMDAWAKIVNENSFILGSSVSDFESKYSEFAGVKHTIGVANGTDAIELLLRAIGLEKGEKVLVPANTFIATPLAAIRAGLDYEFIDVDPNSMLLTSEFIKQRGYSDISCVVPVNLYGQLADSESIAELVGKNVKVIEDGAQSQGAELRGQSVSKSVEGVSTSFYPGKNLGAFGDGGAILTNNANIYENLKKLRNYGSEIKYHHPEIGFNSRLDSLQAAVLSLKLRHLDQWNEMRRKIAARYLSAFEGNKQITLPGVNTEGIHVWHLFVIRVEDRDRLQHYLADKGIDTGIHYPTPAHLHGAFRQKNYAKGDFPNAESIASTSLSLPLYPGMTESQQDYVIEKVVEGVERL